MREAPGQGTRGLRGVGSRERVGFRGREQIERVRYLVGQGQPVRAPGLNRLPVVLDDPALGRSQWWGGLAVAAHPQRPPSLSSLRQVRHTCYYTGMTVKC